MIKDVTLSLTAAEALIVLGAVEDRKLDASRLAAISTGEEHEIADLSSRMLGSVARQIVDALYPEQTIEQRIERVLANCGVTYSHDWHRDCDGVADGPHDDYDERPRADFDREGDPAFNGAFNRW